MILDAATGYIKTKFFEFLDPDGKLKTSHMPIHKINTKSDPVSGKENEQIIIRDVNALAYFDVDVSTPTDLNTLVSNGDVRVVSDGKAV